MSIRSFQQQNHSSSMAMMVGNMSLPWASLFSYKGATTARQLQHTRCSSSPIDGVPTRRQSLALGVVLLGMAMEDAAYAGESSSSVDNRSSLRPNSTAADGKQDPSNMQMSSEYVDPEDGFRIVVPTNWLIGTGQLGEGKQSIYSNAAGLQRVVGWTPMPETSGSRQDTSISITIKTPGADYTSLGSFGSATDFAEKLISQMDTRYMLRGFGNKHNVPITTATLIDARESKGKYFIEYKVSKSHEPTRLVWSCVAMGTTPRGQRRFFTVNATCREEDKAVYASVLKQCVESFASYTPM